MDLLLDPIEVRVLGCLLEKELATPEYCPLTLNALVNACNQKSNRDPVMLLTDDDVERALGSLAHRQLAIVSGEGGRVIKYRHFLAEKLGLEPHAQALLAELMVRGPQTPGELRARASRMVDLPDVVTVLGVCLALEDREPPLVTTLPRQPGRKEARYAQLFSGPPEPDAPVAPAPSPHSRSSVAAPPDPGTEARLAALEAEVAALRAEVAELRSLLVGPAGADA
jgi:uncharacterized protein YceH (UPF0502 family)